MASKGRIRAGVDLGGTKIQVVMVDDDNKVIGQHRRLTPTTGGPADVCDAIAQAVQATAEDAMIEVTDVVGVGVGAPGQVNVKAGTLTNAGNLPGWMLTYPLAGELGRRLGIPISLGNDVQVAVDAEIHLGAGRSYNSLLGVFCGTGVGGGVVIDRKLWIGAGAAGEIGHMVVQTWNGAPCTCGRTGCMEAYAGRGAMEIQARKWVEEGRKTRLFSIMEKKGRDRLSSGVWASALKRRDRMAVKLVDRAARALGAGVASAVNLLDVEAVIIGGGLGCRLGHPFVHQITEAMHPHLLRAASNPPAVLLAELGDLGGAQGAALLIDERATTAGGSTT